MPDQTLECKAGHTWTRPLRRGPKPQWCPEHHPANHQPEPAPRKDMAEVRAAKVHIASSREQAFAEEVATAIASTHDEELRRKLAYCQRELGGQRDARDHSSLAETTRSLLRQVQRHLHRQAQ